MSSINKQPVEPADTKTVLGKVFEQNIEKVRIDFGNSSDLIINEKKHEKYEISFASIYIHDMADAQTLNAISEELAKLINDNRKNRADDFIELFRNTVTNIRITKNGVDFKSMYSEILAGNTVFLIDGSSRYFSVNTSSSEGRAITEPSSQTIIKGPKDSFTEDIDKNVFLIRKRIRNEALRVEDLIIGTVTHTRIKMLYINGIAKGDIVADLRSRVAKIDYDGILDSSYIEEIFKTDHYSIFPTILNSERPDSITAALLEGRVAFICDGSPYVLSGPAVFSDFIQASDDFYQNFYISSFMRMVRYVALLFTLLVPATFIALITFHHEIIPTPLLISIAAQREGVPFPALFEVLLMDLAFEILREAGIRMPRAIGSAISIVGALVLGQAAVEAGLVAAATVIVVALTAISSLAITNYAMSNAIRLLRFVFLILAGMLGLYGISMGLIIMVLHLCKIKSASVPYMSPVGPFVKGGNKDTFIRFPLVKNRFRPSGISGTATERSNGQYTADPKIKEKPELR